MQSPSPTRLWRQLRRQLLIHRRLLAGLLAGAAVLIGLQAATAPPPATVGVWTAAHDLPGGTVLGREDLRRVGFTPNSVPAAAIDRPQQVVGRTLAVALTTGEPITAQRVLAPGMARGRPGEVAVPVRVTDPDVVRLLRVGDQVALVAADPQGSHATSRLAEDATVLGLPKPAPAESGSAVPGRLVVFSVPASIADAVSTAGLSGFVTVIWGG